MRLMGSQFLLVNNTQVLGCDWSLATLASVGSWNRCGAPGTLVTIGWGGCYFVTTVHRPGADRGGLCEGGG